MGGPVSLCRIRPSVGLAGYKQVNTEKRHDEDGKRYHNSLFPSTPYSILLYMNLEAIALLNDMCVELSFGMLFSFFFQLVFPALTLDEMSQIGEFLIIAASDWSGCYFFLTPRRLTSIGTIFPLGVIHT